MTSRTYEDWVDDLRDRLSEDDFRHSVDTGSTAGHIAARFGVDVESARLAGLLHDYSRCVPLDEMLERSEEAGLKVDTVEREVPYLAHAALSAQELRETGAGLTEEVLEAIERHTFGDPAMTPLDKVVYVADSIEPGRAFAGVEELREAAERDDLDELFRKVYAESVGSLVRRRKHIHPRTLEVWNSLVAEARR